MRTRSRRRRRNLSGRRFTPALGTSEGQLQPLTDAATSIRHGNTKSAALAAARVNRDATLVLAEDVLRRLAQHEGVSW
ncbi:MAG: hypothetical protein ACRDQT_06790 [Gaiellaceae bacterium]